MAGISLTNNNDVYISDLVPVGAETSNNIMALGGDDQVQGNQYVDYIHGGSGNDTLWGMGGDDVLLGESGNDTLYGGTGEDLLLGGDNNDILYGGQGNDRLWGGTGDDSYVGYVSDSGIDTINDDKSPTGRERLANYTYVLKFQGNKLSISGSGWHSSSRQAQM